MNLLCNLILNVVLNGEGIMLSMLREFEIPKCIPYIIRVGYFAYMRCDSCKASIYNSWALIVGPIASMCQVRTPAVDRIITNTTKDSSTVVPISKPKLNPSAVEFISSRSESEASSVTDEAEYHEPGQGEELHKEVSPSKRGPKVRTMGPGGNILDLNGEGINDQSRFRPHPAYGWESPQVRI